MYIGGDVFHQWDIWPLDLWESSCDKVKKLSTECSFWRTESKQETYPLLVLPGNLCYHCLSQLSDLCNSVFTTFKEPRITNCQRREKSPSLKDEQVSRGHLTSPLEKGMWGRQEQTKVGKGCVSSLKHYWHFMGNSQLQLSIDFLSLLKWNTGCTNEASTSFLKSFMFI